MEIDRYRPRFKPHFHVTVVEPNTVYLLGEHRHVVLTGRLYCRLAPLLDGTRTLMEIARELRGVSLLPAIRTALERLERRGLLLSEERELPAAEEAFWTLLGVSPGAAAGLLRSSRVSIFPLADGLAAPLIERLAELGVAADTAPDEASDLVVVPTRDYLQPGIEGLNRRFLDGAQPWMLIKPVGAVPWLGPIFVPGRTGCWSCLAHRLRRNRVVEMTLESQVGAATETCASRGALPSTLAATLAIAATEIVKWLVLGSNDPALASRLSEKIDAAGGLAPLEGRVASLDLAILRLEHHVLTRRPQCLACGCPAVSRTGGRPVTLESRPKRFTADGGHRICTPRETVARLGHLVSPITGVVGALGRFPTEHDELVHYYASVYPFLKATGADELAAVVRQRGGGKGMTEIQARASALAESIERHSALYTADAADTTRASFREVEDEAVHPRDLLRFSEHQYQTRDEWNPRFPARYWVPEPFDEDRLVRWTRVWSLTHSRPRLVPTAFAYFGAPLDEGPRFCQPDSNGNAGGNCLEEAILQGLLELVERDGTAIWWYNRAPRPAVDLASFGEPYLAQLLGWYEARNRELWVLDLTTDLGVPTFGACSRRTDGPPESITMGFGAHLDARVAMLRAVTELNQANLQCRAVGSSPAIVLDDPLQDAWMIQATLAEHQYLAPDPRLAARASDDYPQMAGGDVRADIATCVEILRSADLEALVLDQTQPDLGLAAVKVIAPGLRSPWHRLAPGRLYEVPVRLGWTAREPDEAGLNRIPFPV